MIAADSSSLSAFFKGEDGADVLLLQSALSSGEFRLPPVVITELLSDPLAQSAMLETVAEFQLLEILDGYWHRAGEARRLLKSRGLKAKTGDALIAQSCIDHDTALITRDSDCRHFAKQCGLKLA
jgi:predicted nucleic acid-binding protein